MAPGSARRFDRLSPQRADTYQFLRFEGRVPLLRKRSAGRFAVLLDLRVLNIVVYREGMRRRWSGKSRVRREIQTSQLRILDSNSLNMSSVFGVLVKARSHNGRSFGPPVNQDGLIDCTKINLRV